MAGRQKRGGLTYPDTLADDGTVDIRPGEESMIRYPKFEMRLGPADRQKLDALAAAAGVSRANVFKQWLRSAEPPGEVGDSGETAEASTVSAVSLSDQL